jgi:superfamily II DNA or RNA helicase
MMTYQAIASFGPTGNDEGGVAGSVAGAPAGRRLSDRELLASLHPNGQRLLAGLQAVGPATLVLDECHHLLETWGRLLLANPGSSCPTPGSSG